jgi:hypothetical protein
MFDMTDNSSRVDYIINGSIISLFMKFYSVAHTFAIMLRKWLVRVDRSSIAGHGPTFPSMYTAV